MFVHVLRTLSRHSPGIAAIALRLSDASDLLIMPEPLALLKR